MKQLVELKSYFHQLLNDYSQENKSIGTSYAGGDEADLVALDREQFIDIKVRERKLKKIQGLRTALKKMDRGEFGTCVECGEVIEEARLKACPETQNCIHCQEEEEFKIAC